LKNIIIPIILLLLSTGCVPSLWQLVETPELTGPTNAFTIQAPVGWVHASAIRSHIIITRDGPSLQRIMINRYPHKAAFARIGVVISENTLVTELNEYYVAAYKEGSYGLEVNVLENMPAEIDGNDGFRLHLEYAGDRGLMFDTIVYGFLDERWFYHIIYQAPRLHYFEKYLPEFEKVVKSFALAK